MTKPQSEVWKKRSFPYVPMNDRDPKPRSKSITEIRGPYYASVTPTYTKELLEPPNPNGAYGHYTYGLSGFSNVIFDFQGADGVIGIHGTNDPSSVGKDVSHGCLRITNDAIDMLAKRLPLGVPVEIDE